MTRATQIQLLLVAPFVVTHAAVFGFEFQLLNNVPKSPLIFWHRKSAIPNSIRRKCDNYVPTCKSHSSNPKTFCFTVQNSPHAWQIEHPFPWQVFLLSIPYTFVFQLSMSVLTLYVPSIVPKPAAKQQWLKRSPLFQCLTHSSHVSPMIISATHTHNCHP